MIAVLQFAKQPEQVVVDWRATARITCTNYCGTERKHATGATSETEAPAQAEQVTPGKKDDVIV